MVLYLDVLEGVLKDHCAILQAIRRSCQVWEVESPVSGERMRIARENLEVVGKLLEAGIRTVPVAGISG